MASFCINTWSLPFISAVLAKAFLCGISVTQLEWSFNSYAFCAKENSPAALKVICKTAATRFSFYLVTGMTRLVKCSIWKYHKIIWGKKWFIEDWSVHRIYACILVLFARSLSNSVIFWFIHFVLYRTFSVVLLFDHILKVGLNSGCCAQKSRQKAKDLSSVLPVLS